jgi:hypothetical protein
MTYVPTNRGLSLEAAGRARRTRGKSGDRAVDRARGQQGPEPDRYCGGCLTNRPARQFATVPGPAGPVPAETCRRCSRAGATLPE